MRGGALLIVFASCIVFGLATEASPYVTQYSLETPPPNGGQNRMQDLSGEPPPQGQGKGTPPRQGTGTSSGKQGDEAESGPQRGGIGSGTAQRPPSDVLYLRFDEADIDGTKVKATNVSMSYAEYEVHGGRLEGDMEDDLVFTDGPVLTYRGQTFSGDAVHFNTKLKTYRIDNVRTALTPEFLRNTSVSSVYVSGGSIGGREREPVVGSEATVTTCDRASPHYEIQAGSLEVNPGKRLTLRRAAIAWHGRRVIVLPTVIVPLDRRLPRGGYQPTVGRSVEEGVFVKAGFNYLLSPRAPGMYRVDAMERKGIGLGIEQAWNLPRVRGEATLYGIPFGPEGNNLSGRVLSRFLLGAGSELQLGYNMRRNDYRTLPDTTDENITLGYMFRRAGLDTQLNLSSRSTTSGDYTSDSRSAVVSQRFALSRLASAQITANYSRYSTGSTLAGDTTSQVNELLNAGLQADYRAENYTLQLTANRNIPVGDSTAQSYFSGVERLPEVSLSRFRFTRGPLAALPLNINISAGKFSEGSASGSGSTRTITERAGAGFEFGSQRYALTAHTDLDVTLGFTQYVYGEGAAQYILRNNSSLTTHWGSKSGIALHYTYQQPHGGTPFRFDQQGKYHTLTADMGLLDGPRFQFTVRAGYDLAGSQYGGLNQPWQTLSANLYIRPVEWCRLRNLFTYDPNTGEFVSLTSDLRLRGRNDFALDVVSRYDPRTHRFGQVNAYANLPVLPTWRLVLLTQYNGYLNRFESRNMQIIHDMHCLEACLTYIDNPYGWRADRQIMFQLRVKAFPSFQQFGTGLYGQALDTSVGERF